jgi:hypothetical protein
VPWYNEKILDLVAEPSMTKRAAQKKRWLALGVIVLGAACIAAGVGLLLPKSGSAVVGRVAAATQTTAPTATETATPVPTWTPTSTATVTPASTETPPRAFSTQTPVPTLALLSTPAYTPEPLPTPAQGAGGPPEGTALALTIVHTNDTWGYTEPCG